MKKIVVGAFLLALFALNIAILPAIAQNNDNNEGSGLSNASVMNNPATVLEVNKNGKILMRGTIASIASGSNSLAVKSWGGSWTINIGSSTQLQPKDISKFQANDFLGIQGIVNQNASWTIDAMFIRNWTAEKRALQETQQAKQAAKDAIKALMPKNWQGTVSNINTSANSLSLTVDSVVYSVNLTTGAQLVNKNWSAITLANVNSGDTVRVWGQVSSSTITASVLRDISVPR